MGAQTALEHDKTPELSGSWKATVTATNPSGLEPITSLITFIPGGAVIETRRLYISTSPLGPLLETQGHGQWVHTKNSEFQVSFIFLLQGAPNNVSENGNVLGTDNIRLWLSLNQSSDQLTGTFVSNIKDITDNVIFTASGNYHATLISAQQ